MYTGPVQRHQLDVRLVGDTVTVVVNRKPVIRSRQLRGPAKGAIDDRESEPDPLLLQSLGGVKLRNDRLLWL
jgi:hypothetical protein